MDRVKQYLKINDIQTNYYNIITPYQAPSIKRVKFNLQEMELHYQEEFDLFIPDYPNNQAINDKKSKYNKYAEANEKKNILDN
jgi:hypothetical protein